jgi:hypothetical protein
MRHKASNLDKTEEIFGYSALNATHIEPQGRIELTVFRLPIAGNREPLGHN